MNVLVTGGAGYIGSHADPAKIRRERGWRARTGDLQKIIETAWRWRRQHPEGYGR